MTNTFKLVSIATPLNKLHSIAYAYIQRKYIDKICIVNVRDSFALTICDYYYVE